VNLVINGIKSSSSGVRYLFDLDGWQIRHPPDMDNLKEVDPRLAELAEQSVQRYEAVLKDAGEIEMDGYSAYSSKLQCSSFCTGVELI
jgi:histone-lysine N-methyltransferase SUV39H